MEKEWKCRNYNAIRKSDRDTKIKVIFGKKYISIWVNETKELPTPIKMLSVPVMPISFPKKDEDESSAVKVVEIKNKGSSKVSKKSVLSELNTLKDVSHSMPIIDVRHDDKTKNEKFFASAELL
ncbi:hypothetical protein ACH3XW_25135 [Acanthocheilonema viteae]